MLKKVLSDSGVHHLWHPHTKPSDALKTKLKIKCSSGVFWPFRESGQARSDVIGNSCAFLSRQLTTQHNVTPSPAIPRLKRK